MEEIDNIVIDSLRNISCNIDEEIHSLKEFTTELVFSCLSQCLEIIIPDSHFPRTLPPSMSLRLKLATTIAEHIKELGYRGDMGYQTILYSNEIDIRRVLMFLVERLPRESHKSTVGVELGYVPKLVKKIQESISASLEKPWVPSGFLKHGARDCGSFDVKQNFGHCHNLQTENIQIPNVQKHHSEAMKQYWVHYLPDVTKQCLPGNLIPSLLYKDSEFMGKVDFNQLAKENELDACISVDEIEGIKSVTQISNKSEDNLRGANLEGLLRDIDENQSKFGQLQQTYNNLEMQLEQIKEIKSKKEAALKDTVAKIKTRSKTLAVLRNNENLLKLKNLVDNGNKRLVELANRWNDVQTPLLEEYQELLERSNTQKSKIESEEQRLQDLKNKRLKLTNELADKHKLEQELLQEYEKLNKNTNRSAYTRRILEIIANIKKQNDDIQKVLKDTKIVQKDINNINGQLDRSFTLADELIFRDAKRDEMARKAYKLLVTLHKDCGEVVQAVTNLGLVERESRNLQEQIDAELLKETSSKLERLNNDIAELKKENAELMQQLK